MGAAITIDNLGKRYSADDGHTVQAISNLSFQCNPGDFLCILGPTGCGKTTLLRLLSGLAKPTEGRILIDRQPLEGIHPKAGYVFQQSALFPWLRALGNVAFALRMQGMSREARNEQARFWLDRVGLAGFERAYPHELSGGMAQRIALARALIVKPSLLLLDEPFGALDERTRHTLQNILLDLWRETRATIVFVTHNVEEAVYLGQRILVMAPPPEKSSEAILIDQPHPRDRLSEEFVASLLQVRKAFEKTLCRGY